MSDRVEIFARCDLTLGEFAHEVESILDIRTTKYEDKRDVCYYFVNEDVRVEIISTDNCFDNDRDANFEDFNYYISMSGGFSEQLISSEESLARRDRFANAAFDKLRATGRFPLMMTHNVETVLRRYDPSG